MTDNFANIEPVLTVIISRESVEGAIVLLLALNKNHGGHRFTDSLEVVNSPEKYSDDSGKASTFMLVTLKVSNSELLNFECQIRGNLADGSKLMEPSCVKR